MSMPLIENLAEIIYTYKSGLELYEFEEVTGEPLARWEELEEWERDEYRFCATKVFKYLTTGIV